jgi:hypothetical protein
MLWVRSIVEQVQRAAALAERQQRAARGVQPRQWDLDALPIRTRKASTQRRQAADIELVVVHVTAVRGGFGVQRWGPEGWQTWLGRVRAGDVPAPILAQLARHELDQQDEQELARRLALWCRYRNTPYHQIATRTGDSLANRRLSERSWHGNAGNVGVGFAVDCSPTETCDGILRQTAIAAFRRLVERLRDAGNKHKLQVAPHRAFSAQRRGDTGREVWRQVVRPAVAELDGVDVDLDLRVGNGRPVPRSWDPQANHDDRGREIAADD